MAKTDPNIQQWLHNRSFLTTIHGDYSDWIVTVAFYTALHAVDTLLVHDNVRGITSHDARNRVLQRTKRYEFIWKSYRPLHEISRTVRYLAQPTKWVPHQMIRKKIVEERLYPIEKSVQKLISRDLGLGEITIRGDQSL